MSQNWSQEQQDAYNDLAEDGAMFTFSRQGKGKPDPITGEIEDRFDSTFTAPGILLRTGPGSTWNRTVVSLTEQGLIQSGDEVLLVAAMTYAAELEDRTTIDGETWVIKSVSSLRPGIVPLLHYLVIRKG